MSETECINCGVTDDKEHGIHVGLICELNKAIYNIRRAELLKEKTVFTFREADTTVLKEKRLTHEHIAQVLNLSKSPVDECILSAKQKIREAQ